MITRENQQSTEISQSPRFRVVEYAVILKPRVMSLVVFTALVGLIMAPGGVDTVSSLIAIACIAIGAGASGAINMWYDRDIDQFMLRTMNRPLPAGRMEPWHALAYGVILAIISVVVMDIWVNRAAAGMLGFTILYYIFIYTMWLKRRTPQNIVIGGASGALPPVIGWATVTGDVGLGAVALFFIIFLWTPPHTWALALFRREDYENAGVPMLPVVAGEDATRKQIVIYTWLTVIATAIPFAIGMSGWFYGIGAIVLGFEFLRRATRMKNHADETAAKPLFLFSILYLFLIFFLLLSDKALMMVLGG